MTDKIESKQSTDLRNQWEALVERGLRGGRLSDLVKHTEDGIIRGPLRLAADRPEDISPCPRFGAPLLDGRPWHICAPVRDPDVAFANGQLLEDLKGGASAIRIELDDLKLSNTSDVKRLLEGVYTDLVPITIASSAHNVALAKVLLSMDNLHSAHITLGLDGVSDAAAIKDMASDLPRTWRAVTLSPASVHDCGGTAVQELAVMAASVAQTFRNLGADLAHRHMAIELASDQDAHMGIAKIRAARKIYATIAGAFGINNAAVPIHAVTSARMMQSTDPWSNMLRVMSAGFGAVIGGADYIITRPFTDAIGHATPFGHRTARNMQLLMMEESHLGHVSDPAFGSYFHERMTTDLAQGAWAKFQEIEASGGIDLYMSSGTFKADLNAATTNREAAAAPILGVTLHPTDNNRAAKTRSRHNG